MSPQEKFLRNKKRDLKSYYGLTIEDFEKMLADQGGTCAICSGTQKHGRMLAVDHNHDTGKVRGLLCDDCNRGIGMLGDSKERLIRAVGYIRDTE
jgi:hypothetical protein